MRWHVYTWTEKSVLPDNNMRSLLAERDEQADIRAISQSATSSSANQNAHP